LELFPAFLFILAQKRGIPLQSGLRNRFSIDVLLKNNMRA